MEISVRISNQELANAPASAMQSLMAALQAIARYGDCEVLEPSEDTVQNAQDGTDEAEPAKKGKTTTPAPATVRAGAEKAQEPKQEKAAPPKAEKAEEPAPKEEPEPEKEKAEAGSIPDRNAVRKRLAEIRNEDESKAPKILEILHEFGVKKFSDLPDENLAAVLEKAEAL